MKSTTPFMTRIPGVQPSMMTQMTNTAWVQNTYQEMLGKVKVRVPSGWLPLVMILMEDLAELRNHSDNKFLITCLECRNGMLHVELDTMTSSAQAVIEEHQLLSSLTCQTCSAPGHPHEINGGEYVYCRICAFVKDATAVVDD
jgi:hypothetical protein